MQQVLDIIRGNESIAAAVWLVGSLVVALLVRLLTTKLLPLLTGRTRTGLDDYILHSIARPLFATVVFVGASFALAQLKPNQTLVYITNGVLISLGVLMWVSCGLRIGQKLLSTLAKRMDQTNLIQTRTLPMFDIVLKAILYAGAAYGILLAWEVNVTAWLASAGILGIAIGFAAKDTLANLFSGIFIIADAPYKIGDFIVLDSGERGRVTDIGLRSTRILTRDDIQIILPNATIANAKIVNESGGPHVLERVRITLGVTYGSDIDQVRQVLLQIANQSEYLAKEPTPRVRFREFGESSLNFQLMGWIAEPVLRGRAIDELNSAIYKTFNQKGIQFAFPQLDVHFDFQQAQPGVDSVKRFGHHADRSD